MNRLAKETSPYLLQHAHNPVDWFPWGGEAFDKALQEDKPVLVSIGYSTCHWCHVMERESFEDLATAEFMNAHFINIKIDREERPDLDHIYMEAVQLISGGSGGWPLNCFLLPDKRPFYGGTYFPPKPAFGRGSWMQVLGSILQTFQQKRDIIEEQATKLLQHLNKSQATFTRSVSKDNLPDLEALTTKSQFTTDSLDNAYYALRERFDRLEGGFGTAPKFPSTMALQTMLLFNHYTGTPEALFHVELSLYKMIHGGIYDALGGGFSRYATDREWLVPHFEKMLYDNALLVTVLSEAYKATQNKNYRETIEETLEYIAREMTSAEGGYYSAQDADSEGEEGKYYVWTKQKMDQILGEDSTLFCQFYDVTEQGNWEHNNILHRSQSYQEFARAHDLDEPALRKALEKSRGKVLEVRNQRIKPLLDDKIILAWNAMMTTAHVRAYQALGHDSYQSRAESNIQFLLNAFPCPDGRSLYHTYKNRESRLPAFLDDYALFIEALLEVYNITFDLNYLTKAKYWTDWVIHYFWDATQSLFYYTTIEQTDVIVRQKDIYDGAIPSGNSTMVRNLQRLSVLLDDRSYREMSVLMLGQVIYSIERFPSSLSRWLEALYFETYPIREIAIIGNDYKTFAKEIQSYFLPNTIIMASDTPKDSYPLLANKGEKDKTLIYFCENYACQLPLETVEELLTNYLYL